MTSKAALRAETSALVADFTASGGSITKLAAQIVDRPAHSLSAAASPGPKEQILRQQRAEALKADPTDGSIPDYLKVQNRPPKEATVKRTSAPNKPKPTHDADKLDPKLVAKATEFIASIFVDGAFDKTSHKTLADARAGEAALKTKYPAATRGTLVYAVVDGVQHLVPASFVFPEATPAPKAAPKPSAPKPAAKKAAKKAAAVKTAKPPAAAKKTAGTKTAAKMTTAPAPAAVDPEAVRVFGIDRPNAKHMEIIEAARAGKLPPLPDFSAPTHKYYKKHLDAIAKLARKGDVKAIETYEPKFATLPYCGSRTPLCRFRDLAIIALKAKKAA